MYPICNECSCDRYKKYIRTGEKESKSLDTNMLGFSDHCATSEMDGYVYKRRKLRGTSVALLSDENATEMKLSAYSSNLTVNESLFMENKDNLLNKENLLISGGYTLHKPAAVCNSLIESVPHFMPKNICSVREDKVSFKASNGYFEKTAAEHATNINDRFSSSEGNMKPESSSKEATTQVEDSASGVVQETFRDFTSSKELCIFVLKSHDLLLGQKKSKDHSELVRSNDADPLKSCKVCGNLGNPLKMLICDGCEEAFHLPCCDLSVKKLPLDDWFDWFCKPCSRNKPKSFLQTSPGKSLSAKGQKGSYRNLIPVMLRDDKPYTTMVRIGKEFQVEVSDWSTRNSIEPDHFDSEPTELDPSKSINTWSYYKSNSIGHWIECREVINEDSNGESITCGKWRRAPFYISQTADWDCSCALPWDPIHADCAVPQELPTDQVLQQRKFAEKVWAKYNVNTHLTTKKRKRDGT